jgi:hypothetical protein
MPLSRYRISARSVNNCLRERFYEATPRGKVLTLSGLQFLLDITARKHAMKAGVRQKIDFYFK